MVLSMLSTIREKPSAFSSVKKPSRRASSLETRSAISGTEDASFSSCDCLEGITGKVSPGGAVMAGAPSEPPVMSTKLVPVRPCMRSSASAPSTIGVPASTAIVTSILPKCSGSRRMRSIWPTVTPSRLTFDPCESPRTGPSKRIR